MIELIIGLVIGLAVGHFRGYGKGFDYGKRFARVGALRDKVVRYVEAHEGAEIIVPVDYNEYADSYNDLVEHLGMDNTLDTRIRG